MTPESNLNLPDGVAAQTVDGYGFIRFWDAQGRLHNPVGPAVRGPDKATFWLVTGRDPAMLPDWWFNQRAWFLHGQRTVDPQS